MDLNDEMNERKRQVVNLIRDAFCEILIAKDFKTAAIALETAAFMCKEMIKENTNETE